LTLLRNGEEQEVSSLRTPLEVITVKYHVFSGDSSVGVIRISAFYSKTPMEVKAAVETLKGLGCTKFIFDVRYNGGGEKNSIVNTLDYILPEGKLLDVVYKGSAGTKTYRSDESYLDAKVAVLINNSTASAAELFAAALRDFTDAGKFDATLVGTTTYGKGVFQTIFELSDGSAFKVSCGRYDPPSGVNYDGIGVAPDVFAELSEESKKINFYKLTDENDDQLILAASILSSK
jgi:carboxyl-terminal processing protease